MDTVEQIDLAHGRARYRQARLVLLAIALPLMVLHVRGVFIEGDYGSLPTLLIGIPLTFFLLWRRKIEPASLVLLGFAAVDIFIHMADVAGLGLQLGIMFAIGTLTFVYQLFQGPWRSWALWPLISISVLIVIFDLYWPMMRRTQNLFERFTLLGFTVLIVTIALFYAYKNFANYSLRAKFLVAVATLAIAGIVVNTFYVSITSRSIALDNAGLTLKTRVEEKAELIGRELDSQLKQLLIVSSDQTILESSESRGRLFDGIPADELSQLRRQQEAEWVSAGEGESAAATFLSQIQQINPNWSHLVITDLEGGAIAMSPFKPEYDFSQTPWFQEAAAGHLYIGKPELSDLVEETVIPLAVPIKGESGQTIGVVRGLFQVAAFNEFGSETVTADLAGSAPVTVYFPGDTVLQLSSESPLPLSPVRFESLAALATSTYEIVSINNQPTLIAAAPIAIPAPDDADLMGAADLYAITQISQAAVISNINNQQRGQIIIGLLILIAALAAAVVVSNLVSQPILDLIQSAERLAAGDFDSRAPVTGRDEIATLAVAFNQMADQVQFSVGELEMRVNERTAALNASNRVAQTLASSLNQDQIINVIVHELKEKFDYYHAHVYLLDTSNKRLVLVGGSGKIGAQLLDSQHTLPVNSGLVGLAASTGQTVLIEDVTGNDEWVANPLLPDTKSEIAVPIILGGDVVGVLDVQDDDVSGLDGRDQQLLETVANQLAISLRNAQLFEAVQDQSTYQEKLIEINDRLRDAQSIEEVLQIASQEVATYLDVHAVTGEIKRPNAAIQDDDVNPTRKIAKQPDRA